MLGFWLIFGSFIIGAAVTGWVMTACQRKGMYNEINPRSSHKKPVVRGVGAVIVIISIPMGLIAPIIFSQPRDPFLFAMFIAAIPVAYIGWLDDVKSKPAWLRLLVQMVAVGACLYYLPQQLEAWMPLYVEKCLFFFAWVWFINLYNFMDGIDGFATANAIFMAVILSTLNPLLKPFTLAMAGSGVGFLRLNFTSPAKAFLGDVGSTFLGFTIGGMLLFLVSPQSIFSLLTLSLMFCGDATFTLIKRTLQGKKPWHAHKDHWYQRAVRVGLSHRQVTINAVFVNVILALIAAIGYVASLGPFTLILGIITIFIIAKRIEYLEGK